MSGAPPAGATDGWDRSLCAAIIVLLAATPWPFGSRLSWAAMLSASFAITCASAWLIGRTWTGKRVAITPLHAIMVAFLTWVGMQWLFGWTIYAHGTAYDGVLLLSYAAVFAVSVDLARERDIAYRLQIVIIVLGLAVGTFALLQYLTWNGRLFWVFELPYGGITFGPFNNRNYFAGYMLVTMSVAVAALLSGSLRKARPVVLYLTWLGVLSLLLSLSRGGLVGFAAATFAALILRATSVSASLRAGPGDAHDEAAALRGRRSLVPSRYLVPAGVIAVLAGLALLQQTDRVFERLETLFRFQTDGNLVLRMQYWRDSLPMIWDRPITGFGLGNYVWVFPGYRSVDTAVVQTNAHNEYIEMAVETGLVGAAICAFFLVLLFRRAMSRLRQAADTEELGIRLGAVCAWIGICVYAITDFPTVIPAIDYVLAVLAALAVADIGPATAHARTRKTRPE